MMRKYIAEPDTLQMTKWLMCIECWIPKATYTLPGYVTLIAFLLQQWLCERASLLRYTILPYLFNITYTVTIPTVLI
jgi:hypothetical protein